MNSLSLTIIRNKKNNLRITKWFSQQNISLEIDCVSLYSPLWNDYVPRTHRNHNLYNWMPGIWSRTIPSAKHSEQSQFFSFHRMFGLSATRNEKGNCFFIVTECSQRISFVLKKINVHFHFNTRSLISNHNRCLQNGYNKFGFL